MEIFAAQLINSIASGSIYALLVTGFNLLLIVGGVVQFAFPHIVVMGMYLLWMVLKKTNNMIPLSIVATIGGCVGMSLGTEPLFRPLVKRGAGLQTFLVSLGISMIILDAMSRHLNMGLPISFPQELAGAEALWKSGLIAIRTGQFLTIIGSIIAVILFFFLLYRTRLGGALRAMAQDLRVAQLLGLPIRKNAVLSFVFAGLLGGVAAIFLSMTFGAAWSTLPDNLAIKVVASALLAGLGNLRGGLIGAYILGLAEGMALAYLPGDWAQAVAFGMIIIVVMVKPQGLFGVKT